MSVARGHGSNRNSFASRMYQEHQWPPALARVDGAPNPLSSVFNP
jgi:hypothetical protein